MDKKEYKAGIKKLKKEQKIRIKKVKKEHF
jgi:hypothetical protein